MIKKDLLWLLPLLLGLWLLSACQSGPPVTHYLILSADDNQETTVQLDPSQQNRQYPQKPTIKKPAITIERVQAVASLKTKKMEYKRNPHEVEYYTQSEWATDAPQMIQALMAEALLEAGLFQDVVNGPHHLRTPLQLELFLYRLRQDFTTEPYQAIVRLQARLLETQSSQTIFSHIYQDYEPIAGYNAKEGVEAFNRLFNRLLPRIKADLIKAYP